MKTPNDWIEKCFSQAPWLHYIQVDGLDFVATYNATKKAEHYARAMKEPVFLHIKCVRLLGHAGVDYEPEYRDHSEIETGWARDPLLYSAAIVLKHNILSAKALLDLDETIQDTIKKTVASIGQVECLGDKASIMKALVPEQGVTMASATGNVLRFSLKKSPAKK